MHIASAVYKNDTYAALAVYSLRKLISQPRFRNEGIAKTSQQDVARAVPVSDSFHSLVFRVNISTPSSLLIQIQMFTQSANTI